MQALALVALCVVASVASVSAISVQGWTPSGVGARSCATVCRVANVAPQRRIFQANFDYVQSLFNNTSGCKKYIQTPVDFAPAFNPKTGDCYVMGENSSTTASVPIPSGVQRLCCCSSKGCPVQPAVPLPPPAFTLSFHGDRHEGNKTETIEGRTWIDYAMGTRTEGVMEDGTVGYFFTNGAGMSITLVDPFMAKRCISSRIDGNIAVSTFPFLLPFEAFKTALFAGFDSKTFEEPAQLWYINTYGGINIKTAFVWTIEANPRPLLIVREFDGATMVLKIHDGDFLGPRAPGFFNAPACDNSMPW